MFMVTECTYMTKEKNMALGVRFQKLIVGGGGGGAYYQGGLNSQRRRDELHFQGGLDSPGLSCISSYV